MKKSNQEISVLHIEFPLHTVLIIGGTMLEIDWHISHFWLHYKIRNCQHYINGQSFRTMESIMNVEHGAHILVRQYLTRVQH